MYKCDLCGYKQDEPGVCPTCGVDLLSDSGEDAGEAIE